MMESVISLANEISTAARNSVEDLVTNEATRRRLLEASKKLTRMLEKPEEVAFEVGFWPFHTLAVRVAVELGLFKILANAGANPLTAPELAKRSESEVLLIVRIMRPLAACQFVQEVDVETYKATRLTHVMAEPSNAAGLKLKWDEGVSCLLQLVPYLSQHSNKCPENPRDGLLQRAFNTELEAFEYWAQKPEVLENYNVAMSGIRSSRTPWFDWFPVEGKLLQGTSGENNEVLMIDVAGGFGHDIAAFKSKFSGAKGRFVLQDQPKVIDSIKGLDEGIERHKHDIFTEQPIKGARIYFSHFVLHDWSDANALKILRHTASAMKPGYSKILLNEFILPDRDCSLLHSGMDFMMMGTHAALERSEKQWTELLTAAGLKVVKFWHGPNGGEGVVEVDLKG